MNKHTVQVKYVSIIIPNWNGIKFIQVCLDSVLRSEYRPFEVIVVDNGSSDGSREVVESYLEQDAGEIRQGNVPVVRLVRLKKNRGFARACNEGINVARGEYFILLNNDVEVTSGWLSALVEGMERHPECGMGTSKMVQYDNRRQIYNTGDLFKVWGTGGARGFGELDHGQYETEEYVYGACAGAGIYRRTLFEKIGLFDEKFFIFAEDVDLNLRAAQKGFRCVYIPKAVVYHWGTATVGFNSNRHVFLFLRNNLFVLVKNYSLREFLTYGYSIVQNIIREAWIYSLSGQGHIVFMSRLSFLWFFPLMMIKRLTWRSRHLYSLEKIPEIVRA